MKKSWLPNSITSAKQEKRNTTFIIHGEGDLFIDNQLIKQNVRNGFSYLLSPGQHRISVKKDTREISKFISVPQKGTIEPLELILPAPKQVVKSKITQNRMVEYNPVNWVNVFLDHNKKPTFTQIKKPFKIKMNYGKHMIRFENPYAFPLEKEIIVNKEGPVNIIPIRLQPLPAKLWIKGAPAGSILTVGDQKCIVDPTNSQPCFIHIPEGQSSLSLKATLRAGDRIFSKTLVFRPALEQTLEVMLKPL